MYAYAYTYWLAHLSATGQTIHTHPATFTSPVRVVRISGARPLPDPLLLPHVSRTVKHSRGPENRGPLTHSYNSSVHRGLDDHLEQAETPMCDGTFLSSLDQASRIVWYSSNISPIRRGFARHSSCLFPTNRRCAGTRAQTAMQTHISVRPSERGERRWSPGLGTSR